MIGSWMELGLSGVVLAVACLNGSAGGQETPAAGQAPQAEVPACDDFSVTGKGDDPQWKKAHWIALSRRAGGRHEYATRFKLLYSGTGIYVLFDGQDQRLSATIEKDFEDLWKEDVFECFFWPDPEHTVYFEYEISPLGAELPILVPNLDGRFLGWRPWHYEGDRKIRKKVYVDGPRQPHARIRNWRAEMFIPYALLEPLGNVPPKPGTQWRANFYRVDYDDDSATAWDWARVGPSFHEFQKFGTLVFR